MIDTDKYEGHTEGPWKPFRLDSMIWTVGNLTVEWQEADKLLIADAPLLLQEVKRLREALRIERRIVQAFYDYRDARCYEDCEAWMLEKGHRVMVKYGNEEQSEWKVEVE